MAETPRTKIVGDYICEKCERYDHSDHAQGWGGICIGCSCAFIDKPSETLRKPDRFDKRAREIINRLWHSFPEEAQEPIAAALRAEAAKALQVGEWAVDATAAEGVRQHGDRRLGFECREAGLMVLAHLKPDPAAAPAAETGKAEEPDPKLPPDPLADVIADAMGKWPDAYDALDFVFNELSALAARATPQTGEGRCKWSGYVDNNRAGQCSLPEGHSGPHEVKP